MEKLAHKAGVFFLWSALILVATPLSVLCGWLAGWTVSLFANDMLTNTLAQIGIHNVSLPHLGATMGFVSAFLRTRTEVHEAKK